jgi:hypothetical protein
MRQTSSKKGTKFALVLVLVALASVPAVSAQASSVLARARADARRLFQLSADRLAAKTKEALVAANLPKSTLYQVALAVNLRDEVRWVSNDPPAYLNERAKQLESVLGRFKLGTDAESERIVILARDESWGNKQMVASSRSLAQKNPGDIALQRSAAEIAIGNGSTNDIEWAFGVISKLSEANPKTASYAQLRGAAATMLGKRQSAEKRKYFEIALKSYRSFLSVASKDHPSRRLVEKFVQQLADWLTKNGS